MSKLADYLDPTPTIDSGIDAIDLTAHTPRDATSFRRILAACENLDRAEQELRDAVAAARDAGDSWTVIGAALGTSRQNVYQRFGKERARP